MLNESISKELGTYLDLYKETFKEPYSLYETDKTTCKACIKDIQKCIQENKIKEYPDLPEGALI